MRRVASSVTGGGVDRDPTAAPPQTSVLDPQTSVLDPQTSVLDPQTSVLDSTAPRQQEGQEEEEEEEEEGEGSKPVTGGRRRRQGEEGRKRKWKSHVPQQCPVCRKVIHDARNLPRHMGTHTERSCTYLNGLGLCLSVGNVSEREDRTVPQTTVLDSTALQGGGQLLLGPSPAPLLLLHRSEHNRGGGGVGEGIGRSSMSVNGGAALLTPPPHRPPSSSAALLMPPPPAPPDQLLKHEEEEEEEEGFRPATVAPPPSGEALPASVVPAEPREGSGGGAGGDSGGRKRRFPSQMPQQCPVCRKVIHGAGKLPRHMRTHAERSCTYNLSGLGLCLSVGNVEEREDSGTRDSGTDS